MKEVSDTVQSLRQHAENIGQGCSPVNSTLSKRLKNAADLLERTEAERAELEADRNEMLSLVQQANARFLEDEETIGGLLLCQILCPIDGQGELRPNRLHTESSLGCQEATRAAYVESIKDMDEDYDMEFDADGEVVTKQAAIEARKNGGSDE